MRSRIGEDQVVAAIYDTVLQPDSWQQCFHKIRQLLGADSMLATMQDPARGEAKVLASNLDPLFLQHYAEEWWRRDTWALGAVQQPRGKAHLLSELVPDKDWMGSDIYNELVRPLADARYCIGAILDVGDQRAVMGLQRTSTAPDFVPEDREVLQRLIGHIGQSLRMARQVALRDGSKALLEAAIDSLAFGLVVVDPDCRPLAMNRLAEACLGPGLGLLGGRSGEPLKAENPMQTLLLHRLVREASRLSAAGAFRIERTASAEPLLVQVAPLTARQADLLEVRERASLILLHRPTGATLQRDVFRSLFGLTGAEARLAQRMARGESLKEIAAATGLSVNTLRVQLRGLLLKTDTDRQPSLVRLLAQLSVRIDESSEAE